MSCFRKYRTLSVCFRNTFALIMNKSCSRVSPDKTHVVEQMSNLTSAQSFKAKFEVLPNPVKSESDKKQYRVIRLENGLTACLVADKSIPLSTHEDEWEDEESSSEDITSAEESEEVSESENEDDLKSSRTEQKLAAAALCIGVGSYSDPKEVPGMAHFLEHMVFMGSEKFPAENDFDSFIKKGGGSDNASTDAEVTSFYFECLEKNLYKALDKFAQFFIAPLMKKGAMTRERESIESEFQIALPSDSSRREQLLLSLANPDSPVNSFAWGNLITLRDNISDDKLYEGVHEFRRRHYSAHRMTLAIQARLPIETLQDYVLECFAGVPNNKLPPLDFKKYENTIFNTPEFNKLYYIKPMKDLCQVELTWALPNLRDRYRSKPHQYVSYLLGDEGKGSLLSYLRNKVWALATSIGNGESGTEHNSMFALFTVTMVLTEDGLKHLFEVIEAVFAYIRMLKDVGPQERIFNEIKSIADTAFRFSTEEDAVDLVEELSESMQTYPPEHYITGSELYFDYDPEGIKMVTDLLVPERMNIFVLSNTLPDGLKFDKTEKWFGTQYAVIDLPPEWLNRWSNVKPYPELNLPYSNPYLTTDFSILPDINDNPDYPQMVINSQLVEMWYRKDQKFKLPTGLYNFYLINPNAVKSPFSYCMLDMLVNLLTIEISEEAYPATYADLSFTFNSHEKGLVIKVKGYNQKLPVLIQLITKHLNTLSANVTAKMFEAVKDKMVKAYYNKLLKPSALAKDIRLNLLISKYWTPAEKYSAISEITFEAMRNFAAHFLDNLFVKVLVQGNISKDVAIDAVNTFVSDLKFEPLSENKYSKFRVVQVPLGERCCRTQSFNKKDSNSIITNYYQSGPFTVKTSVLIELIMLMIEEPLFDVLRTKEQLGYQVACSATDTCGILGYTVSVNAQATKYSTRYVDERIEAFLMHTEKLLSETTEKQLNITKSNLIKMKQCVDVHLKEEVDRNWSEIIHDDYIFDRLQQEINAIGGITLEEIRNWWSQHNKFGLKTNFRKISFQVIGYNTKEKKSKGLLSDETMNEGDGPSIKATVNFIGNENGETKPENYFIRDIKTFKQDLFIYPVITRNS